MANSSIWLYTGKFVDVLDIESTHFDIHDFAHALSQLNRYTGNTLFPYSVGEHSVKGSKLTPVKARGLSRAFLIHDCSEVICNDLPNPVKRQLPEYEKMEERIQRHIFDCFGEPWENMEALHEYDRRMCRDEMEQIFPEPRIIDLEPVGVKVDFWSAPVTEYFYMKRAYELDLL
jgi:5'-deoxynucleotidase YfbR-like HD superfamily hydrolase